ncbi:four helix bundle protein [Capnocytophaga haemolytica]|uniref:four helix bundle protein n=2 Tax=Capnocytophaga haemolytica TaxID=45243 RepID=UPI00293744FE|nr:four helix bundle protein [Capnocytophaga haemolytica]
MAEGKERNSLNDYIHFLYMARGSLFELETQLTLSKKLNFVEQSEEIEELINEVRKMLHALINKLKEINNNKV